MKLTVVKSDMWVGESYLVDEDGTLSVPRLTYMVEEIAKRVNMHEELVLTIRVARRVFLGICYTHPHLCCKDTIALLDEMIAKANGEADGSD